MPSAAAFASARACRSSATSASTVTSSRSVTQAFTLLPSRAARAAMRRWRSGETRRMSCFTWKRVAPTLSIDQWRYHCVVRRIGGELAESPPGCAVAAQKGRPAWVRPRDSGDRVVPAQQRELHLLDLRCKLYQAVDTTRAQVLDGQLPGGTRGGAQRPAGHRSELGALGERLRVRLRERVGEALVDLGASRERVLADAQHLDREGACEGGLGGEDLEERVGAGAQPSAPAVRLRAGCQHLLEQDLRADVP